MAKAPNDTNWQRRSRVALRITAGVLLAFGLFVLYATFQINQGGGFTVIGPRGVPFIIAIFMIALALLFILKTTILPDQELVQQVADEEAITHWPTVGLIAVALVGYAISLRPLGYPVATTLFLPIGARILGSRRPWRDLIVGLVIGFVVYFCFTRFLGVRLPPGLLAPLIG
jgi:putative tricarboxylic transport membrane protein